MRARRLQFCLDKGERTTLCRFQRREVSKPVKPEVRASLRRLLQWTNRPGSRFVRWKICVPHSVVSQPRQMSLPLRLNRAEYFTDGCLLKSRRAPGCEGTIKC